jgi:Uma2 family endonuclease
MLATKTRYTFADLLEQSPDDSNLYEILGGELVVFASPDEPHAAVVFELALFLGQAQRAGYGRARVAPRAVAFDWAEHGRRSEDVPQPDVFFVREERREVLGFRAVEAAPDLVIEVFSPTTRAADLPGGRKFAIYERYGVPFYWIVDADARTISQYPWRAGQYDEPVVLREGDTLGCPLFPDVTVSVSEVFSALI